MTLESPFIPLTLEMTLRRSLIDLEDSVMLRPRALWGGGWGWGTGTTDSAVPECGSNRCWALSTLCRESCSSNWGWHVSVLVPPRLCPAACSQLTSPCSLWRPLQCWPVSLSPQLFLSFSLVSQFSGDYMTCCLKRVTTFPHIMWVVVTTTLKKMVSRLLSGRNYQLSLPSLSCTPWFHLTPDRSSFTTSLKITFNTFMMLYTCDFILGTMTTIDQLQSM